MRSSDNTKTALLIIDVQKNVMASAYQRDQVIANVKALMARARAESVPVIWVQHSNDEMKIDSEGWQIVSELQPLKEEVIIRKVHGDAFEDTNLESNLDQYHIGRLIVAGAQTDACIRATIHGAFVRGYDTVLVGDAHTTEDLTAYGLPAPDKLIEFTNAYWTWQSGPGRSASVEKSAEVKLND